MIKDINLVVSDYLASKPVAKAFQIQRVHIDPVDASFVDVQYSHSIFSGEHA
jgi:chromosome condensin MukBEF complex kleisin-like MukF subunit